MLRGIAASASLGRERQAGAPGVAHAQCLAVVLCDGAVVAQPLVQGCDVFAFVEEDADVAEAEGSGAGTRRAPRGRSVSTRRFETMRSGSRTRSYLVNALRKT